MVRAILIFGLVAGFCISKSLQMTCKRCNLKNCAYLSPSSCAYGTVKDMCGCCSICAKGPGEECGGLWNAAGICGIGYFCQLPNLTEVNGFENGICAPEMGTFPIPDEPDVIP